MDDLYAVKIIEEKLDSVKIVSYYFCMQKPAYHHGDLKNALVQAGIEILASEGLPALSLRRVAGRAGVSHSAPYAHFADKQALIAAISTEGFRRLNERLDAAAASSGPPARGLFALSDAYLEFALAHPALFKLMFSGALEREMDYADFVAVSRRSFRLLVEQVRVYQQAGVLRAGPEDVLAVGLWSLVHGLAELLLERQISHQVLDRFLVAELLCGALNQMTMVPIDLPAGET